MPHFYFNSKAQHLMWTFPLNMTFQVHPPEEAWKRSTQTFWKWQQISLPSKHKNLNLKLSIILLLTTLLSFRDLVPTENTAFWGWSVSSQNPKGCRTTVFLARPWRLYFCETPFFFIINLLEHFNAILIFRLDYGFSSTERLYDYVTARTYGEHEVT